MSEIDPSLLDGDKIPQGRFVPVDELDELHENTDLDVKGVLLNTFILIALCGCVFWVVTLVMNHFASIEAEMEETKLSLRFPNSPAPPSPTLQNDPGRETAEIFAAAKARLGSYGWVDREAKTAHIPIERAMAILAEKGLPKRGKMDEFHPRQGSSNPVKVGVPGEPEPEPASEPTSAPATPEGAAVEAVPAAGAQP